MIAGSNSSSEMRRQQQPAAAQKYRDPASGATWSGRRRARR
nr:H-NS family nucleoid-associated regulatory protein [Caballeronia temeraria]